MSQSTLEQILADEREQAAILRRNGHAHDAGLIERVCDAVGQAAEEYLRWLSEEDAMTRSDKSRDWLRSRFSAWEAEGHARRNGRKREYRMLIVPQRVHTSAEYEAGRQAGKSAA